MGRTVRPIVGAALLVLLALLPGAVADVPTAGAATGLPAGFVEVPIATGITKPTAMALAPDGRIFVTEQGGNVRVIKNASLLSQPFASVTTDSGGERGLLGIAFDPNFTANQYVYVYYTAISPNTHNRLSRFTANGDVAVPGSEQVIVDLEQLSTNQNHNGGAIHFGPDGKLYIAVGENGTGANAQSLANRKGKILRINSDGSIPTDNPFYLEATGDSRSIWALGLRNPFRFAFQAGTGRMFINDVGAMTAEEINDGIAGSNYGWPATEGYTTNPSYRSPLYAYSHGSGPTTGCSITGGAFYNPAAGQFPAAYAGDYFFADYCTGWIRHYDPMTDTAAGFATGITEPVDLLVAPDGRLYYLARSPGRLRAIVFNDTDSDGDGCGDQQEQGSEPALGGQRDPDHFWDFFDTETENGLNAGNSLAGAISVADIGRIVTHFGQSGDPGIDPLSDAKNSGAYHTRFDRTGVGPNSWNLGPPDGTVSVEDILHVVNQFGHNCS